MRLLVIQHDDNVPPGLLTEWAAERGHELVVSRELLDPAGFDAVVPLGSYASVLDGAHEHEAAYLRETLEREVPVVGICFGAQLLAHALGGSVRRLETPEATWDEIGGAGPFLLWHEDAFTAPPGADSVVEGPAGDRFFRRGRAVGVQHHPEVTAEIATGWAATSTIPARAGADPDRLTTPPPGAREAAFRLFDELLAPADN